MDVKQLFDFRKVLYLTRYKNKLKKLKLMPYSVQLNVQFNFNEI